MNNFLVFGDTKKVLEKLKEIGIDFDVGYPITHLEIVFKNKDTDYKVYKFSKIIS